MDWTAAGTIIAAVALAGTALGAMLRARAARRQLRPRIVFSDLHFAGPMERPRPAYRFAVGVRLTNIGGGPALHLTWGFLDPDYERRDADRQIFAEMVRREALAPEASTEDWSGVRGVDREEDPDEHEARAFYERAIVFAECWDVRGKHYIFFPFGGGPAADPHGGPLGLRALLASYPSRGETPRSAGVGPPGFVPAPPNRLVRMWRRVRYARGPRLPRR